VKDGPGQQQLTIALRSAASPPCRRVVVSPSCGRVAGGHGAPGPHAPRTARHAFAGRDVDRNSAAVAGCVAPGPYAARAARRATSQSLNVRRHTPDGNKLLFRGTERRQPGVPCHDIIICRLVAVNRSNDATRALRGVVPILVLLLTGVLPVGGAGQTYLSFTIADSLTSRPVEGTLIELTTPTGSQIWRGRAGADGIAIARVTPGQIVVTAQMIAYMPAGPVTITVPEQDSVFIRILLSPAPLSVDSLAVTSRRRGVPNRWERWGFEWRRVNRPVGLFYGRSELQDRAVHSLSSLLRRLTSVRVIQGQYGTPQVYMSRDQFLDKWGGSTACGPDVYKDGMLLHEGGPGSPAPVDDLIQMSEIVALEIYRSGAEVPMEFEPNGFGSCGAIVVWTR
jgi:hypothetical protein